MRIMVNKKSQMKIQQMAFMLIAIMIFFALVGLIILTVGFSGLKEKATALQEENANLLVSKLANSPEFSCGQVFESKENCIDLDKVFVLKNNINKYKNFWGVSGIEIIKVYPENKNLICASANYPNCDTLELIPKSTRSTPICTRNYLKDYSNQFVSCKRSQEEMVGFALIIILVSIILLVFLAFSLSKSKTESTESYEVNSFLQSTLQYTTAC